jgi:hypothetical protein
MAGTALTYNSFDLNDSSHITSDIQDAGTPDRNLAIFNLIRSGGGVITDSTYYTKAIKVVGKIVGTSMTNLESILDSFHAAMAVENKNLDIGYNSSTRRYVATPAKVSVERPVRAANWASFEIDFVATEYGKDTSATTLLNASVISANPSTSSLVIGGSAPDQLLRIQITLTAIPLYIQQSQNVTLSESKTVTRI